jgi:pimeloyl-ACP methyl ester carboxylesterase
MPHVDGVEHRVIVVDGLRLHYAEAGAGDPLVLLHGWPQHWWCWRAMIGPLAARYRVICPDTRGQGWSEGSATGYRGYRLHRLAADLAALLDALGIDRVRLVGHDWGAAIGYRACLNWPERFERYVALAGVTPWSASGAPLLLWLRPWHIYALAVLGPNATTRLGLPEHALRSWRHVDRFTPDETQTYLGPLRRPASARATHAYYRSVVFHEIPHFLRHYRSIRLHVPTLHLNGEDDPLTRGVPDSYRRYAEHMRLELIPGCGHFMAEERPAWLLDRLLPFLD